MKLLSKSLRYLLCNFFSEIELEGVLNIEQHGHSVCMFQFANVNDATLIPLHDLTKEIRILS
jgi:hypothetical protein